MSEHFIEVLLGAFVGVLGAVGTITTSLRGFSSLKRHVDAALQGKISVEDHRKSIAEVWDKHNTLRDRVTQLESENASLRTELARMRKAAK